MASIPLIALAGRPPEPVDTLGQYSRIMALKQAQQQMQFQQQQQPLQLQQEQQSIAIQHQQLVDQQAFHDAYSTWDGKDYDTLAGAVGKNGGSFQVVNGIRMAGLNQQKELSEILKNQGEAGKARVQTLIDNNTIANQKISSLTGDDPQAVASMAQEGFNTGWLDQQHAQALLKISQLPSDQMKATLPQFAKPFLSNAAQAELALKQTQQQTAATELPVKRAQAQELLASGLTPSQFETQVAANKAKAEAQARLGSEMTLANYNKQLAQQNMIYEHQLNGITDMFNNPQHGYSQSLSQMQATKQAVLSARDGNELAASLAPVMTALGVASYAGMHRVNQNEINAAGPQVGSILRQVDARLEKAGAGKLAPGTAQEVADLMDNLIDQKYNMAVNAARLSAQNGHIPQDKVYVMDRNGSPIPLSQASAQTVGVKTVVNQPSGATMKVPGSDGHMHWSDGQRDLGRAD